MEVATQSPNVAFFPCPGMSHLTPFAELAKQLVLNHGFSVTLITMSDSVLPSNGMEAFLKSLPSGINSVNLPPVDLPSDLHILSRIFLGVRYSLPALRAVLHDLKQTTRLAALVADTFCVDSFDVAKEVGIAPYLFSTTNLFSLSLSFYLPSVKDSVSDIPEPLKLPGCLPVYRRDFPDMPSDEQARAALINSAMRYGEAQGILANSFYELEPETEKVLREKEFGKPPVYVVGPLIKIGSSNPNQPSECLKWLEQQPHGSVLYISFGSIGMLTREQMKELAEGLELSGQRFLWVVRCPVDKDTVEGVVDANSPLSYLTESFKERTKERGFLETGWAPQVQILRHSSTAGFLTHCGWNSTLESIAHGVAMIAWPMYAEQKMNAALLEDAAKVAVRPKPAAQDGVIRKEEVARVVKELMEGEEGRTVRDNVQKLQKASAKALTKEGSSYMALDEVAIKWKNTILL